MMVSGHESVSPGGQQYENLAQPEAHVPRGAAMSYEHTGGSR